MQPRKMAKERGREETTPATPQPSDGDGKLQNKKNPLRVLPLARTVNIFVGTRARARARFLLMFTRSSHRNGGPICPHTCSNISGGFGGWCPAQPNTASAQFLCDPHAVDFPNNGKS